LLATQRGSKWASLANSSTWTRPPCRSRSDWPDPAAAFVECHPPRLKK
jgi:hypothetical protein